MGLGLFDRFRKQKTDLKDTTKSIASSTAYAEGLRSQSDQELWHDIGVNKLISIDEVLDKQLRLNCGTPVDLAFAIHSSNLIRNSWVSREFSQMQQLIIERAMIRIEAHLAEREYEYGNTNLLEALSTLFSTSWENAINGNGAKLLKATMKQLQVTTREEKVKGQG